MLKDDVALTSGLRRAPRRCFWRAVDAGGGVELGWTPPSYPPARYTSATSSSFWQDLSSLHCSLLAPNISQITSTLSLTSLTLFNLHSSTSCLKEIIHWLSSNVFLVYHFEALLFSWLTILICKGIIFLKRVYVGTTRGASRGARSCHPVPLRARTSLTAGDEALRDRPLLELTRAFVVFCARARGAIESSLSYWTSNKKCGPYNEGP